MKSLFTVSLVVLLAGCTTVQFDNGVMPASDDATRVHQWHHSFGYELYEASSPINPNRACSQSWESVSYDNALSQWIATGALFAFFGPSALANGIWMPRLVTIQCNEVSRLHGARPKGAYENANGA